MDDGSKVAPTELGRLEDLREQGRQARDWAREVEESDLLWLMGQVQGRRFLARLMTRTGQWHTTFRADAREAAFAEGMRNVTTPLFAQVLKLCPERFVQMTKEWSKHERAASRSGTERERERQQQRE